MFGESQISPLNKDSCISPFDCQPFHPAYLPFTNDATSATPCSVCEYTGCLFAFNNWLLTFDICHVQTFDDQQLCHFELWYMRVWIVIVWECAWWGFIWWPWLGKWCDFFILLLCGFWLMISYNYVSCLLIAPWNKSKMYNIKFLFSHMITVWCLKTWCCHKLRLFFLGPRMFSSLVDMSGAWIMCGVKACSGEDMSEVPVQFCNTHFLIFHSCRMMWFDEVIFLTVTMEQSFFFIKCWCFSIQMLQNTTIALVIGTTGDVMTFAPLGDYCCSGSVSF